MAFEDDWYVGEVVKFISETVGSINYMHHSATNHSELIWPSRKEVSDVDSKFVIKHGLSDCLIPIGSGRKYKLENEKRQTQLRVGGQLSEEIHIARGVRQGDPLSPVLFNTLRASPLCDACRATESVGHILQSCPRTYEARNSRHDAVNKYLNESLIKRGFTTLVEPPIPTPAGLRYPDIVAFKGDTCAVVDTTIIGDTFSMDAAHVRKQKYYDTPAIREWCSLRSGVLPEDILFSACVLNWRRTPSNRSNRELHDIAGITHYDWTLMSLRTIEGGTRTLSLFRRTTSQYPSR